ncbi:hypothetical protein ACVIJ1_005677 [Bradyrhizobium elkanii]
MRQLPCHQPGRDGAGDDGHESGRGVGSQHDLEGIEGAGQRSRKRCADRPRRAAGHQQPHVVAAGGEALADMGAKHRADLRVSRFQSDRPTEPVGQQRLDRDQQAAAEGHPAAIERVGFDGVSELLSLHASREVQPDQRQDQAANCRDQQGALPGNHAGGAEMCVEGNVEQQRVRGLAEARDRRNEDAAQQPDDNADQHEASLAIAHEIAQELRQQTGAGSSGRLRGICRQRHPMPDPVAARCARQGSRSCSTGRPTRSGIALRSGGCRRTRR